MIKAICIFLILVSTTSCSKLFGSKIEGLEESVDGYLNLSGSVSQSELQGTWKSSETFDHFSLAQVFDNTKALDSTAFILSQEADTSIKNQNCEIDWSESHDIKTRYLITFKGDTYKIFSIVSVDKSNTICSMELSEGNFSTYSTLIYLKELQVVYELTKTATNQINIGFTSP